MTTKFIHDLRGEIHTLSAAMELAESGYSSEAVLEIIKRVTKRMEELVETNYPSKAQNE